MRWAPPVFSPKTPGEVQVLQSMQDLAGILSNEEIELEKRLKGIEALIVKPALRGGFNVDDIRYYGTLAQAVAAIPATQAKSLFLTTDLRLTANLTIPSNIMLHAVKGSTIDRNGFTLTFSRPKQLVAGDFQVFTGSGTVAGLDDVNAMWFGATDDGVDSTAAILAAATGGVKQVTIPRGVKFDIDTLMAGLPTSVVCLDFSVINDYTSAGETAKAVGILSKDQAENDTHQRILSGHHVILQLNNSGHADTLSGAERKASLLWAAGLHTGHSNPQKRGFRGIMIFQFTRETGGVPWKRTMRAIAPWVAIGGIHLTWEAGQVISGAGIRRSYGRHVYVSAGAGTNGATPPTHTTGTVSDGGTSWTYEGAVPIYELWEAGQVISGPGVFRMGENGDIYVSAGSGTTNTPGPTHRYDTAADGGGVQWTQIAVSDATVDSVDEYGRVLIGQGPGSDTFRHRVGVNDLGGSHLWWGPGQSISGAGVFRRWGNRLYESTGAGVTGATPPTHITGSVSDGTVTWAHVGPSSYTDWAAGQVISAVGTIRRYQNRLYISANTGTTGATPPTHESGTVADGGGGVQWTFMTSTQPGAHHVKDLVARGLSKDVLLKGTPTDSVGREEAQPYLRWVAGEGMKVLKVDGTEIALFSQSLGLRVAEFAMRGAVKTDNDTSPSVNGLGTLFLENTNPTSITAFDDGSDDQILRVVFVNGNTTLVHSNTLMLEGEVDVTPAAWSQMFFAKVPTSLSDRWMEVTRRIKAAAGTVGRAIVTAEALLTTIPTEEVVQKGVQTTDATVTTLHTFAIPASRTVTIEATVTARRHGGAAGTAEDGASYKLVGAFKNVAGTATLIGAVTRVHEAEDQAAWDCVLTASGGNVLLRVTGAANNNVAWSMTARVYKVGS